MSAPNEPPDPETRRAAMFNMLDLAGEVVSTMTGVKQQFIAQGWTDANAQEATLLLWRSALMATGDQDATPKPSGGQT